jgi:voltage-gated potassium channel
MNIRERLHEIIFEAETPAGKAFDVILLLLIGVSVLVVTLESIPSVQQQYGSLCTVLEWVFTVLFSIEYILRIYATRRPLRYVLSFWGIIDLLAVIPTYLSLLMSGTHYLLVVRDLRLLRIFRIFKLTRFLRESKILVEAIRASRLKITVFLIFVSLSVTILGAIMYVIEGKTNPGFSSIPDGIYWAIVTLTTVGYGDISPVTDLGRFVAALVMILGYAVLAVPTGIVSAEMVARTKPIGVSTQVCRFCTREGHDTNAQYCKFCGEPLHEAVESGTAET